MDIDVITDVGSFSDLEEEWNDLFGRCRLGLPFLTHAWVSTWWGASGEEADRITLAIRDGGRLVGVAPLHRDRLRVKGIPVLRELQFAHGAPADYRDVLVEAGREWDVWRALLEWLTDELDGWDALVLRGIHADSATNELVPVLARQSGLCVSGHVGTPCPFIKLPGDLDSFLADLSGSVRRKMGQKWRNLAKHHGEPTVRVAVGAEVTDADVDVFLRLHESSWEGRGGSAALHTEQLRGFHRSLVPAMPADAPPVLLMLSVGGQDIACIYGFLGDGVMYDYLPGAGPEFERYSVGSQALMRLVEHGIEHGWREIDLMRGMEPYKFHFTRRCRHNIDLMVCRKPRYARMLAVLESADQ
ncbi:MAG TPA: GNAT family N-acetyltransferase [Armatimonadota bacterium]|nr:GNAT family N-acetyltransferase [Armatimonadota bacterium]